MLFSVGTGVHCFQAKSRLVLENDLLKLAVFVLQVANFFFDDGNLVLFDFLPLCLGEA
mgnify:CR=1 FL=1